MATPVDSAPAGEPPPLQPASSGEGVAQPPEEQAAERDGKLEAKGEPRVVIDVKCCGDDGGESDPEAEKVCRICHLNPGRDTGPAAAGGGGGGSELIQIGCGCRGELGMAHRRCAEAWFRIKGNRCCEICGSNAKNINGEDNANFMEEWHEQRMTGNIRRRNSSERNSFWRGQPFCNFLMACLVIAFILPWFFRVNIF